MKCMRVRAIKPAKLVLLDGVRPVRVEVELNRVMMKVIEGVENEN